MQHLIEVNRVDSGGLGRGAMRWPLADLLDAIRNSRDGDWCRAPWHSPTPPAPCVEPSSMRCNSRPGRAAISAYGVDDRVPGNRDCPAGTAFAMKSFPGRLVGAKCKGTSGGRASDLLPRNGDQMLPVRSPASTWPMECAGRSRPAMPQDGGGITCTNAMSGCADPSHSRILP
jgi:hypothetical protein